MREKETEGDRVTESETKGVRMKECQSERETSMGRKKDRGREREVSNQT